MSSRHRRAMRLMLLAHEPSCWFCGRLLTEATATIDHLVPLAAGGRDHPANYRLSCKLCNEAKADHPIEQLVCSVHRGRGVFPVCSESEDPTMKIAGFNYNGIKDPQVRKMARSHAAEIKGLLAKTGRYVVEIGKRLIAIKEALGQEQFGAWLKAEFQFTRVTATKYMRVADRFGDIDCLDNFHASALDLLARDSVPDDLVEETIEKARAGEIIGYADTRRACEARDVPIKPRRRLEKVTIRIKDTAAITRSLDKLRETLQRVAGTMTRDEREALADRFLELALELRRNVPLENPELKPVA